MFAPETKYENNVRVITGTGNDVLQNDVILLCNTTAGPVTINLLELVEDRWNTLYKVYVFDSADNAGTNTITIIAPSGYRINNQPQLVLNEDGAGCIVRVGNNTNYIATLNTTSTSIPGFISLTVAEMQALIAAENVVQGAFYLITDANLTDGGLVVHGINNTEISLGGKGLFKNPDFQNIGGNNVGVWHSALAGLTANVSVAIWNGLHYLNLTGNVGTAPDGDAVNWQVQAKDAVSNNTYIQEVDDVRYDVSIDRLLYRADKRENEVEYGTDGMSNSIVQFQWGNYSESPAIVGVYGNKVLGGSYFDCQNARGNIFQNSITGNSFVFGNLMTEFFNENVVVGHSFITATNSAGRIFQNVIEGGSIVTITDQIAAGGFSSNHLSGGSQVSIVNNEQPVESNLLTSSAQLRCDTNQAVLRGNEISGVDVNLGTTNTIEYQFKRANSGFSNFNMTLDLNDGAIYAGTTLTIPANMEWVGIFELTNSNKTIDDIINLPTSHDVTFKSANNGETSTFTSVAVGGAAANNIIAAQAAGGIAVVGRTNGTDDIVIRKNGTLNAVVGRPNVYV